MEAEKIAPSAISAFESTFDSLVSGNTGLIPESTISPAPDLVESESFSGDANTSVLSETVVLKLNGGLGTGMGLDKAKSLLKVKGNDTFLDLTAKQIIEMRKEFGMKVKFMLRNVCLKVSHIFQQAFSILCGISYFLIPICHLKDTAQHFIFHVHF